MQGEDIVSRHQGKRGSQTHLPILTRRSKSWSARLTATSLLSRLGARGGASGIKLLFSEDFKMSHYLGW